VAVLVEHLLASIFAQRAPYSKYVSRSVPVRAPMLSVHSDNVAPLRERLDKSRGDAKESAAACGDPAPVG
jgi:hypothetical protein